MANVIGRSGGTRAWRNANPGNIIDGATARGFGAIGRDDLGFAIFPDDATGWAALLGLLRTAKYQALSIRDAIFTWAPPEDSNDSATYAAFVAKQLGVAGTTPVRNLTAAQLTTMGEAIRQFEGWEVGTTTTTPTAKTTPSSSSSSYPSAGKTKTGIDLVYVGAGGQTWQVAKKYADQFQGFLTDAFNLGLVKDNPATKAIETFYSSGGYNYRPIAGSTRLSNHAYGAAVDISGSATENYRTNTSIDATLARQLAAKWGLRWGGDYKNSKDYMHFEIAGANGEDAPTSSKDLNLTIGDMSAAEDARKGVTSDGTLLGTIAGVVKSPGAAAKVGATEAKDTIASGLDGITRTVYAALLAAAGLALVGVGIYRTSTT